VVANAMGPNQLDDDLRTRLVQLETRIETSFVEHRGRVAGRPVSDNDIEQILLRSDDVAERRDAWEASKSVGAAVGADLLDLVRLRNDAANRLGFRDHYELALRFGELDEERLFATLDSVAAATEEPFRAWKAELDDRLAARFGCTPDDLRPWHYDDPFFQEPPVSGRLSLDEQFATADLEGLTVRTFDGLGLDVRPALERSDLYERERKNQHAFCLSVDRDGDVRVLSNNVPNERWMGTMLHEFGHATYDLEIDRTLPFLLREPAHMLLTEAVAMLFGRLVRDPAWLRTVAGVDGDLEGLARQAADAQRAGMLVFARWVLVMTHFERSLYREPDADQDARWWDLVNRYQLLVPPGGPPGAWASKIHLTVAPVYYQNYLYGELVASQVSGALAGHAGGLVDRPEAGAWLRERLFQPGTSMRWDRLLAQATGEELDARHFVNEFV
jgi:peptidyl-dipeptidase A